MGTNSRQRLAQVVARALITGTRPQQRSEALTRMRPGTLDSEIAEQGPDLAMRKLDDTAVRILRLERSEQVEFGDVYHGGPL